MADLAYRQLYTMNPAEARKQLIETYKQTGSISRTARLFHTSRRVVRKWLRRYHQLGEEGLRDLSRRPKTCPNKTQPEVEAAVVRTRALTGYGPRRLAAYLKGLGVNLSPHTIRHILRRNGLVQKRRRRATIYPAIWAWEQSNPFNLMQVDVKDIRDKRALGTALCDHLAKRGLPRYQWTAVDGLTRLRFIAFSHRINRSNGLAFLALILLHLRALGIDQKVTFQTDWGQEFGGDNPEQVAQLSAKFLAPLGGELSRYPKGRKEYNGRVERSHRADDEEFYRPYLGRIRTVAELLELGACWVYFYNFVRPHFGYGLEGKTPMAKLREYGAYPDRVGFLTPVLLDRVSTSLLLAIARDPGNNLLAHYMAITTRNGGW